VKERRREEEFGEERGTPLELAYLSVGAFVRSKGCTRA
jgi:hypothetical protein